VIGPDRVDSSCCPVFISRSTITGRGVTSSRSQLGQVVSCPCSRSLFTTFDPMRPVPPITTIFIIVSFISDESAMCTLWHSSSSHPDHFPCLFRRSTSSRLKGKSIHVARSSAPPRAEKTDKLRVAFTPIGHHYRQCEDNQRNSAQQSSDTSFQRENKQKAEESFSNRSESLKSGSSRRQQPIEFGRIVHESAIIAHATLDCP
jgi:hypothetical protein